MDLVLNNLQWLISHKIKPNQTEEKSDNLLYVLYLRGVLNLMVNIGNRSGDLSSNPGQGSLHFTWY